MPQLGGALAIERSTARILRTRRHDEGLRAQFERAIQIGGKRPRIVNRNRLCHQRQGGYKVKHAGVARIFDRDDVAGPQMGLQDAFDGVERAADNRNRVGRYPVALELPRRQLDQRRVGTAGTGLRNGLRGIHGERAEALAPGGSGGCI